MERVWKAIIVGMIVMGVFMGLAVYEVNTTPGHTVLKVRGKKIIVNESSTLVGKYISPQEFLEQSENSTIVVNTLGNVITEVTPDGGVYSVWSYDLVSYLYGKKVRNAEIKYSDDGGTLVMEVIPANKEYVFDGVMLIGLVCTFMMGFFVYIAAKNPLVCVDDY